MAPARAGHGGSARIHVGAPARASSRRMWAGRPSSLSEGAPASPRAPSIASSYSCARPPLGNRCQSNARACSSRSTYARSAVRWTFQRVVLGPAVFSVRPRLSHSSERQRAVEPNRASLEQFGASNHELPPGAHGPRPPDPAFPLDGSGDPRSRRSCRHSWIPKGSLPGREGRRKFRGRRGRGV